MAQFPAGTPVTTLKVRVGTHEFEASGPVATVQAQFDAFRQLVAQLTSLDTQQPKPDTPPQGAHTQRTAAIAASQQELREGSEAIRNTLGRIVACTDHIVSLVVPVPSLDDEILLLLCGQQLLRGKELATGGELLAGLRRQDRDVDRIDYQLRKLQRAGYVVAAGTRRARRYRLSARGTERAERLARALAPVIPTG